jgi:hypothetical protein
MNRNSYNITTHLNGLSGIETLDTKVFNSHEIEFKFNFISYPNVDLVKMKITFDQKIRVFEFNEILSNFILKKETPYEIEKRDIAIIKLFYSNFKTYEYQFPMIFIPPSILEDFDGSIIQNAQFLDTIENDDLFFVMKNSKNQYFNFRSGSNVVSYRKALEQQTILPTPIISTTLSTNTGFVSADLLTEFNEYIEVNT